MQDDDIALLLEYARNNSQAAFAEIVSRHVNLVYSVAMRQVRDAHWAEEITQAVFIILARKAKSLGDKIILSGWLCRTARYASANALTIQRRRQRREQEAYMQSTLNEPTPPVWEELSPLIDGAMEILDRKDHDAIVLRFFENKNFAEVGAVLGASEDAAKMRVGRALEKLRKILAKRGVHASTSILAKELSANSICVAPALLAKSVSAVVIAKGAAASASTLALAKMTLIAMKTKSIVATIVIAAAILCVGSYFTYRALSAGSVPASAETLPVKIANAGFTVNFGRPEDDGNYEVGLDANTRRTTGSAPAGHIKSLIQPQSSGAADFLDSLDQGHPLFASRSILYSVTKPSALIGKRIRISGWIKTGDVANWVGTDLTVSNFAGHIFAEDNMTGRPIHGTTGWQPVEFVTDIPAEPCVINFAPNIYGTGEMWFDDFQIDVVSPGTPITDDRKWHVWSQTPTAYSETLDPANLHDNHPTLCLAYLLSGPAPKGSWMWWGQDIRDPQKYQGHTVRMTVWIKSANVARSAGPNLRPKGPNYKLLASDGQTGHHPVRGTTDWTSYSIQCVIPKETQCLDTGIYFAGSGKVWIDTNSITYEIVK